MSKPEKNEHPFFGAILLLFCLYVPIHAGGNSQFYGVGIAVGCLLGTWHAVQLSRRENRVLAKNFVWMRAAIGSWVGAFFAGFLLGGPLVAAEALGYSLVLGSGVAWGVAVIIPQLLRKDVMAQSAE